MKIQEILFSILVCISTFATLFIYESSKLLPGQKINNESSILVGSSSCSGIGTKVVGSKCTTIASKSCTAKKKDIPVKSDKGHGTKYITAENGCENNTKAISGTCTRKSEFGADEDEPEGDQSLGAGNCGSVTETGCQDGTTESKKETVEWTENITELQWNAETMKWELVIIETIVLESKEVTYEVTPCEENGKNSPINCGGTFTASIKAC